MTTMTPTLPSLSGATTTLNAIRAHRPCEIGWRKLLAYLGKTCADDEPLPILTILESNGLADALWCLRALPPEYAGAVRLLACDFAEAALPIFERVRPEDDRPRAAIETARWSTADAARAAADAASKAAADASDAAWAAARAAQERMFRAALA